MTTIVIVRNVIHQTISGNRATVAFATMQITLFPSEALANATKHTIVWPAGTVVCVDRVIS